MNDLLFLKYIHLYLIPALKGRPGLFAFNLCPCRKTTTVLDVLGEQGIIACIITAGSTSLLHCLDGSVNKPVKNIIGDMTEQGIRD